MIAALLLLACAQPDPDATGARWDTSTDRRPSTTETGTLSVFDTTTLVSTATAGDTGPDLCLGGGTPMVSIGTGGFYDFEPYVGGETLTMEQGPNTGLGLLLDINTLGFDTTRDINTVLRLSVDGIPAEFVALLRMKCPVSGPGWVQVHAELSAYLNSVVQDAGPSGVPLGIALSLIDRNRAEETIRMDVTLKGP